MQTSNDKLVDVDRVRAHARTHAGTHTISYTNLAEVKRKRAMRHGKFQGMHILTNLIQKTLCGGLNYATSLADMLMKVQEALSGNACDFHQSGIWFEVQQKHWISKLKF
jgi:hypothetical protein